MKPTYILFGVHISEAGGKILKSSTHSKKISSALVEKFAPITSIHALDIKLDQS